MRMHLRSEFIILAVLACAAGGCRVKAAESLASTTAPNVKSPYKGDPYTFGGIQDGTGGLIAATRSSMETESYSEPKFKKLAGPESFASMSGHSLSPSKANETSGDFQPLPIEGGHGEVAHGSNEPNPSH